MVNGDWPFMLAVSLQEAATHLVSIKNQDLRVEFQPAFVIVVTLYAVAHVQKRLLNWEACAQSNQDEDLFHSILVLVYYFVRNVRQATIVLKMRAVPMGTRYA